jgi:DNA topoisomerase-6 subunit A
LEAKGYFQMRGKKKERTLTVGTVKTFAQTLRMMSFSKELVESDDIACPYHLFRPRWQD